MAVSRVKTWIAEILTAADLNAEFDNILNNASSLASPATTSHDMDGQELILDADADTSITASTDDRIDFRLQGSDLFRMHGTVATSVNGLDFFASATGNATYVLAQGTDTNIDFELRSKGTGDVVLADDSGNEIVVAADVASAVNEITITNAIAGVNPSVAVTGDSTSIGLNLVSKGTGNILFNGASLTVVEGGTERGSATAYAVLCGGTTSTAAHQSIAGVGTSGQVLTSNGASALPTMQNNGAIGTHAIWVPSAAMRPTVSNGCAPLIDVETTAGRPDMQVLDFDASADEHAQFGIAFPSGWDEGTVTFRAFWTTAGAVSTGIAIALQGLAITDNTTIDQVFSDGTPVVVTDDAQGAVEEQYVTAESGAVTVANTPVANDMTFFRLFRDVSDANDDMTQDMRLIGIQVLYTIDALTDT